MFSRGKVRKFPMFKYGSSTIEVVSEYVYLGVTMVYSNKYAKAMKKQMDQARNAQFSLLINAPKLCLPIDIQYNVICSKRLSLPYNSMVVMYGALAVRKCSKYSIGIS